MEPFNEPDRNSGNDELPRDTRRAMLKNVIAWCMMAGNLGQLSERIASIQIFCPKTESASGWEIVNRFLADYPRFRDADAEQARHFLEAFLGFCARNVEVDEAAAWLQPLRRSILLTDALELAYQSDWCPKGMDSEGWGEYRLRLLRVRANMLRRARQFDVAREEFVRLRDLRLSQQARDWKELSIIEYEMGYICFLAGDYDKADDHYESSVEFAQTAGDSVGALISGQEKVHAQIHGRRIAVSNSRENIKANIVSLRSLSKGEARIENWIWNALAHLFELEIEAGDISEAARLLEEDILRHPSFTRSANDLRYRIISTKLRARCLLAQGRAAEAAALYSEFLEMESDGNSLSELVEAARGEQELAKDYRDAGRAVFELGNRNSAMKLWRRGLEEADNLGNRPFKDDIRHLLRQCEA